MLSNTLTKNGGERGRDGQRISGCQKCIKLSEGVGEGYQAQMLYKLITTEKQFYKKRHSKNLGNSVTTALQNL